MLGVALFFAVPILICVGLFLSIPYYVHLDMMKGEGIACQRITFKEFKQFYNTKFFYPSAEYPGSCFIYPNYNSDTWYADHKKDYIHASIIIFDGIGRTFYPWSFYRFMWWERSLKKRVRALRDREVTFLRW